MSSGHFLIRFGKDSKDYAGIMGGLKEPVSVELALLRNKALPNIHAKFSFVQEVRGSHEPVFRALCGRGRACARVCTCRRKNTPTTDREGGV